MSDLNDGNEEKNPPTLDDMPIHILTRIVNELDFGSRTKLQKTCHGFQDFINSHNSTCEEMIITFKKNRSGLLLKWSIDQFTVRYIGRRNACLMKVDKEKKEKFLSDSDFLEIGLADFKSAIKNPNFKIKKLSIRLAMSFNRRDIDNFFNKLSETLKSLDQKLKVEKLNIHTFGDEKYAVSILSNIQPEELDEIYLGSYLGQSFFCSNFYFETNQLTSLEQWKTAKSLKMINNLLLDIPVESIIHFDEFAGTLTSLSPENIVFLKKVYLQSVTFKQCYIETWNHLNIEKVNKLLGPVVPFDQNHPDVRHYPIPNSNQWLLLKITSGSFHIYKTESPTCYLACPTLM